MLRFYVPAAAALVLIASLTFWESVYSDRFAGSSVSAEEFGERFKTLPMRIGDWDGVDMKEEEKTLKMAGAVRHVSRRYTNRENGKTVDVWLIVGHSRDICRHTPNICYPSHGYSQKGAVVKQQIVPPATPDEPATFFTAKFADDGPTGRRTTRVFWAWNGNEEGKYKWEAPEPKSFWGFLPIKSAGPKAYYGNNTSLYKLYFTAELGEAEEPVGSNIAVEFAKLMLPEINRSLFPERYPSVERSTEPEAAADFGDEALEADEFPAAEESEDADAEAALESILD